PARTCADRSGTRRAAAAGRSRAPGGAPDRDGAPAPPWSSLPSASSRRGLAGLPPDGLGAVAHALALVGLRRTKPANRRRGLPEHLAIAARERDHDLALDLRRDALRKLVGDRVRVAERHEEDVAAHVGAIADAGDLEYLREAGARTLHHVGDQLARQAVHAARAPRVVAALDRRRLPLDGDRHLGLEAARERALRALDADGAVGHVQLHVVRNGDRETSDA